MKTKWLAVIIGSGVGLGLAVAPAEAQRSDNPNIGHFYMARQMIQITDDSAQVNDMRTNPQPGQQGGAPVGAMPRQMLPRAGFGTNMSSMPVMNTSLPKVVNGVPPKTTPPPQMNHTIVGKKANAGKYVPPKPKGPTTAQSYGSYNGYGGGRQAAAPSYGNYGGNQSSTAVRGSLLHWRRSKNNGM